MGLSNVLGQLLAGASGAVVINKWMGIKNPAELERTIHYDIRNFNADSARLLHETLKTNANTFSISSNRELREQSKQVLRTFVTEAQRLRLL